MNWLPEEEFKGFSTDFFNDFIDTMEIPTEDFDIANVEGDWEAKFRELEPPPMDMFTSLSSEFTSRGVTKGGCVGGQKTVPVMKRSSSSDALSGVNSALSQSSSAPDIKVSKLFQSLSPVSVLENSDGSYSPLNTRFLKLTFPVKGMRSKRKRPTTQRLRFLFPFEVMKATEKKRKIQPTSHSLSSISEVINADGIVRKCTHCETTKTPQWREGPSGPKTLCNACGVRYRSGRLVPEYRPASSPTFIPSVHSNSHRKIVEMRKKDGDHFDTSMIHAVTSGGA